PDGRPDAPRDAHVDLPDAAPDAPPDAPPGPCAMPSLALTIATLAGCADAGTIDGPRLIARFRNPVNTLVAPSGITYVADAESNRIRMIDATGTTSTLVQRIDFGRPFGLALAPDGALYVETDASDFGVLSAQTGTIWKVDPTTGAATVIERNLGRPRSLVVIPDGRILMADHLHHVIGLLDPITKNYSVLAGTLDLPGHINARSGAAVQFTEPSDVVLHPDLEHVVVADRGNHVLRLVRISDGATSDYVGTGLAGNQDGPLAQATFDGPQALAIAADGTLYVSDVSTRRIRRITATDVTTIAGDGTPGWLDTDLPLQARFYGVEGMSLTPDGTQLVIADGNQGDGDPYHRIRLLRLDAPTIPTVTLPSAARVALLGAVRGLAAR
ncbi:MAG: hypothetical protein H0T79_17885, partial [Deltaproteobacteria bacterium]|nr:hypothetical protein [Deltaproteobacteria bacterium]